MNQTDSADERIVEVYRAKNSIQAHLFATELNNAGIECQVVGDQLEGAIGEIPLGWSTAPQILVKESDAPRARSLLLEYEQLLIARRKEEEEEGDDDESDWENEEGTEL